MNRPTASLTHDHYAPERWIVDRLVARGGATADQVATALLQQSEIELYGFGLLLALQQRRATLPLAAQTLLPAPGRVLAALLRQTRRQASDRSARRAVETLVARWNAQLDPPDPAPDSGQKVIPSLQYSAKGSDAAHL